MQWKEIYFWNPYRFYCGFFFSFSNKTKLFKWCRCVEIERNSIFLCSTSYYYVSVVYMIFRFRSILFFFALFSNLFLLLVIKQFNTISHQISILVWFLWAPLYLYYDQNNFQFLLCEDRKTGGRRFKFNKRSTIVYFIYFQLILCGTLLSNKMYLILLLFRLYHWLFCRLYQNERNIFVTLVVKQILYYRVLVRIIGLIWSGL